MATEPWVLTGRDEELRLALAVLDDPARRGLVVRGPAGVGKTRLLAEVVAALPADRPVERVVATAPTIPFAPFAHLLGPAGASEPGGSRLEPPDLLWALRRIRTALVERAGGGRLVLVVDDAHRLDEPSAGLVAQLALAGEADVLVAVRTAEPCADAVVALWREEACALLELQPLSRDEVGHLTAAVLGRWMEEASLDRLTAASGGNPLLVRELLADAEAAGGLSVHRGLARWRGPSGSTRLDALVDADLGRLGPAARAFVDELSVGEPLPLAVARHLTSLEVLGELEQAGVVTVDQLGDDRVRLGHPLFGEVRRAALGPLQVRSIEGRLADAFASAAPGGVRADDLRVVCWRLDAGEDVPPTVALDAAGQAWRRGDAELAERLVRAVLASGPVPAAQLLLAELAELGGRPDEAAEILDGLAARLDDDASKARALTTQIRVLAHVLGRTADAAEAAAAADTVADPVWRGFVEAQWATTLAMLGQLDEAGRLGATLFDHPDPRVRLRALPAVHLGHYAAGRLDRALAAAQEMIGPALAHRDDVPAGVGIVFSALALDLLLLGRFDELDQLVDLAVDPVAALPSSRAYLLVVRGSLALERGRIDEARRLLSESVALFEGADPQGYRGAALALLAEACAAAGDRIGAEAAAAEAVATMAARPARLIDGDSRRACAWAHVADGDPAAARRELLEVAAAARAADRPALELRALHDAVRLGAGRGGLRRLRTVAGAVDGPRAAAVGAQATAVLDGDAAGLAAAGEAFAEIGANLVAAEIIGSASRQLARDGRREAARRAAQRTRALLARCPGAVPLVTPAAPGPALTPRELQVARLAAGGASSRSIADELDLSVRTVDNQLSRAYAKLGIGGRAELAAALADLD